MARDRKRAKQRRQRGAAGARRAARPATGGDGTSASLPEEPVVDGQPVRDTPDSLAGNDFAGAGALAKGMRGTREFDAALLQGADGAPLTSEEDKHEFEAEAEDALRQPDSDSGGGSAQKPGSGGGGGGDDGEDGPVARPSPPPRREGNRAIGFLRASWAELQRVQWPDRPQVTQATAVVLGFVVIAGAYLGAADWVAQKIVNLIL